MRKRKYLDLLGIVICFLFCQLCLTSCGGDSDGDGDENSGGNVENLGDIEGSWELYMTNNRYEDVALTLVFESNGIGNFTTYVKEGNVYVRDASADFTYKYNRSNGILMVNDGYETLEWRVMKVTYDKLTISMFNQMLTYSRVSGSGSGGNNNDDSGVVPETNYAIDNVTDYEFTLYKYGQSYLNLYFTSNYSINADYSKSTWSTPVSATYEKTSGSAAIINYGYKGNTSGRTEYSQYVLVFTSETEGTVYYEGGVNGTFVCKKNNKDTNVSAPYTVGGMTFTAKYGSNKWYRFGQQVSNHVTVSDYSKDGLTYDDIYATYNRLGDKKAELVIYTKLGSYANWEESKYTLDFYTSTTGRFNYYHSNKFNTTSYSGEFTLQ